MIYDTIILKCSESITDLFLSELQKGFYIISTEGQTLYEFLTDDCGLNKLYISEKIKTVFINGGPVDDIYNTRIRRGNVCALSGAMPGIVGAMMRIGSPYAAMRENITVKPDNVKESGEQILFELKLFNVILSDTGPEFLKRGILLSKKRIIEFFSRYNHEVGLSCSQIIINNSLCEIQSAEYFEKNLKELIIIKTEPDHESKS